MQEEELYRWWQYYGRSGEKIHSQGRRLRVLNCGFLNTARGPDFIAARFELDGIIYQGDVECHNKTADWYNHNHHLDKAYRQVVLHLVARSGNHPPVKSQWCQQPVRTITLPKPVMQSDYPAQNCQPDRLFQKQLRANLIRMALKRFKQKVNVFIKALDDQNYHSLFYMHFFRALGYPANANTFQLLAEKLNWFWLIQNKKHLSDDHQLLYALYSGQAGFIPYVCTDSYTASIQNMYKENAHFLPGRTLDIDSWQFAGTRPYNHPHFRLAAGLHILMRYDFQLLNEIFAYLQKRRELSLAQKAISTLFKLAPDTYWAEHYALGKKRHGAPARVCIGEARISELLINVILPLAGAQAVLSGSEGYFAYIQSFYLGLPLVSVYGAFDKKIPWFRLCFDVWPVQAANQSLLLLESDYCRYLLCKQCPVNRLANQLDAKIIDNKIKNI